MRIDRATLDRLMSEFETQQAAASGGQRPPGDPPLNFDWGDGSFNPMESRVSALETHMEYVRKDLDMIGGKLDTLLDRTQALPTKGDLTTFRWQWVATAVAAIALIVGGIIGGLSWIKPDAEPVQPAAPTIIQLPPPAAPQVAKP